MSFKDRIFKNQSPWGSSGPTGGSGNGSRTRREPTNIDELIRNIPNKINRFMPGGKSGGGKPIVFISVNYKFIYSKIIFNLK